MSQVTKEASTVEDDPDFDIPLEPDASDAEEVMNFERARYAPILAELDELEAALARSEDETEREMNREAERSSVDDYLL